MYLKGKMKIVDYMMVEASLEKHRDFVAYENGKKVLYLELIKAYCRF